MGKASESKGDTLAEPGTEYTYDLKAFDNAQEPVSVTSIQRVHHTNASYSPDQPDETIETVEYSDGFGRKAQTRVQAEDLDFGDAGMSSGSITDDFSGSAPSSGDPRVRVTGWKRYNNKGNVVEKWEPFFSEGFGFEDVATSPTGQSVRSNYSPRPV